MAVYYIAHLLYGGAIAFAGAMTINVATHPLYAVAGVITVGYGLWTVASAFIGPGKDPYASEVEP